MTKTRHEFKVTFKAQASAAEEEEVNDVNRTQFCVFDLHHLFHTLQCNHGKYQCDKSRINLQ